MIVQKPLPVLHDSDWRLIEVDSSLEHINAHKRRLKQLLTPADTVMLMCSRFRYTFWDFKIRP